MPIFIRTSVNTWFIAIKLIQFYVRYKMVTLPCMRFLINTSAIIYLLSDTKRKTYFRNGIWKTRKFIKIINNKMNKYQALTKLNVSLITKIYRVLLALLFKSQVCADGANLFSRVFPLWGLLPSIFRT